MQLSLNYFHKWPEKSVLRQCTKYRTLPPVHEPEGRVQFEVFEKLTSACFPNCTRNRAITFTNSMLQCNFRAEIGSEHLTDIGK